MNAFYSSTDNNNDKSGIYYSGVIGKLTDTSFEHVIRFNLYENKRVCTLGDVFDLNVDQVVINPAWLTQVEEKKPTAYTGYINRPGLPGIPTQGTSRVIDQRAKFQAEFEEMNPLGFGKFANMEMTTQRQDDFPFYEINAGLYGIGADPTLGVGIDRDEFLEESIGKEASETYQLIDEILPLLQDKDEPLLEIISTAYQLLTSKGQAELATNGINS